MVIYTYNMYYIYLPKIFEDFFLLSLFSTIFLNVTRDALRFCSLSLYATLS